MKSTRNEPTRPHPEGPTLPPTGHPGCDCVTCRSLAARLRNDSTWFKVPGPFRGARLRRGLRNRWRRDCERVGHDWTVVIHPVDGAEELLGVTCERCGAYYGHRSPFNDHPNAQKLGDVKGPADVVPLHRYSEAQVRECLTEILPYWMPKAEGEAADTGRTVAYLVNEIDRRLRKAASS